MTGRLISLAPHCQKSNDVMIMTKLFTSNYLCLSTRARPFNVIKPMTMTSLLTAVHNFIDLPSI